MTRNPTETQGAMMKQKGTFRNCKELKEPKSFRFTEKFREERQDEYQIYLAVSNHTEKNWHKMNQSLNFNEND